MTEELLYAGVEAQARAVRVGEVSAAELLELVLARIGVVDGSVNAFTVVLAEAARAEARARDAELARGEPPGPLHGVPVAIKEENDVAGAVTTFGGSANRTPAREDSWVTARLREAGAVVVGKTAMPEFGEIPFTESARYGPTRNPWDLSRSPGGSSGGTAAAVASGMVACGIGGDGGGSIRIPAACCGVFGLKPTRGRVSTAPHPDLWNGLGTVGPLTRTVIDSAMVYDVIRGNQPGDRFRAVEPATSFTDAARLAGDGAQRRLRVGWSTTSPTLGVRPAPEHVAAVHETATLLAGLGHEVVEVAPGYPDATPAFLPQMLAGLRAEAARVEDPARLEPRTRQLVAMGRAVPPRALAWAETRAERLAALVDARVFSRCDVLLTPTLGPRPRTATHVGKASAPVALARSIPMVAYTALFNVTGHPAAAVPAGFADDGLPTSVQLVGRRNAEPTLLALAAQVASVRPWHDERPAL